MKKKVYLGRLSFLPADMDNNEVAEKFYSDFSELPNDPRRPEWKLIEGDFITFSAMNVSKQTQVRVAVP